MSNPSAAISIYDSDQTWGRPDCGIQLSGRAGLAAGNALRRGNQAYGARFRSYEPSSDDDAYPVYRFRPQTAKLFYERVLGAGTLVTA